MKFLEKLRESEPKTRKIIMMGNPSLQNATDALNGAADG
jgi:hypothetical protein